MFLFGKTGLFVYFLCFVVLVVVVWYLVLGWNPGPHAPEASALLHTLSCGPAVAVHFGTFLYEASSY